MKYFKLKNKINCKKGGFTLIEIIAVLFVVSLGLIGVLSLIITNIQGQNINKNSIIAYQLAQEGVELMRKVRDNNWNNNDPDWRNHFVNENYYYMDYKDDLPNLMTSMDLGRIYINSDGFYDHDNTGVATNFERRLKVTSEDDHSIIIWSKVFWKDRNISHEYHVEAKLYNWKNPL